ncbi:MAG: hypothetical protein JWO62_953 [Acidimicrobiaceae bacterium]|jgi:hypothetical protein|nr:hypothetical protein [Acidimicrobiaceae bacterium]
MRLRRATGVVVASASLGLGAILVSSQAPSRLDALTRADASVPTNAHGSPALKPLPHPSAIQPFLSSPDPGEGRWHAAGRRVDGRPALLTTTLRLPDDPSVLAGVAWMDPRLLSARLYSGSLSPGGLFWKYTAPISPVAARTLVAAFAGGFLLKDSQGGYLSEGHLVAPLRVGAASLVIYRDGTATVGQWGRDVSMTPAVVAVRQNLNLLIDHGRPTAVLSPTDTSVWGSSLHAVTNTPRSALGVTADGALVYVSGPMTIVDLADVLERAGAVRAMVLDMNPLWPVFASYTPATPNGAATPANGVDLLPTMYQGPDRFFQPAYARDFVTMSAR